MRLLLFTLMFAAVHICKAQQESSYILKAERVFDGREMHENWVVIVNGALIAYAGPAGRSPREYDDAEIIDMPEMTLMPGLIEGHAHVLLHPYNETSWNDQVLKESPAIRAIRAVRHAEASLLSGITTLRDLGSEGAGYADVAVRDAVAGGIIDGPDMMVAGPAIVATGSYGPKGFHDGVEIPLGAQEADGISGVQRVVREQIGKGADFIKVYADYRWGPGGSAQPTFSLEELKTMVETAESSGRYVVAHAATEEGMRRAILAGVRTIEHGDGGTPEIFRLMKEHNVGFCPTLGAVEAITRYSGYNPSDDPIPARLSDKRKSFRMALDAGVTIVFGGDVGVFPHGENAWELELMVAYGMAPIEALSSATSVNASTFGLEDRGSIKAGMKADLIAVNGNPLENISVCRNPSAVIKNGKFYRRPEN